MRGTVKGPPFAVFNDSGVSWSSLASIGDALAFTVYDQAYSVTPDRQGTSLGPLEDGASEIRVWEQEGEDAGRGMSS